MRKYKIVSLILMISVLLPINTYAYTKDETVFTTIKDGKIKENIVNNHLKYIPREDIEDETILKNVLNISGDEKLTNKDNKITFKGQGKDIVYQGSTDKELPIKVDIKYYLDNEEISKKDLLKKKGRVTIKVNLENTSYIEDYNMHTPFVVTVATIVKSDNNYNFEVSNGKVVNTGNRNVIVGIATPGLYNDLGIYELKTMNDITISFDTDKFTSTDIYVVATPKLLSEVDLNVFNRLDNLSSSMNTLQNGVGQLVTGANKLNEGSKELENGANQIKDGLQVAKDGSEKLNEGATILDNTLLQVVSLIDSKEETLANKSNELNAKLTKLQELINGNNTAISTLEEANQQIASGVEEKVKLDITSDEYMETINRLNDYHLLLPDLYTILVNYKRQYDGNIQLIYLLNQNNQSLQLLASTLSETANETSTSLEELKTGLSKLQKEGTKPLKEGITNLDEGLLELYNGSVELANGTKVLSDGTNSLNDGINKLNNEGMSKLTNVTATASNYSRKIKNLIKLSKNYKGYSSNNSNDVIFVYKIEK